MKRYGFEREQAFAQLIHGRDIILETLRRGHRSQSTRAINKERRASDCLTMYARDKGARLLSLFADADRVGFSSHTRVADIDVVTASCQGAESVSNLGHVVIGVASIRCWQNSESFRRQKRKASEHDREEKETASQRRAID